MPDLTIEQVWDILPRIDRAIWPFYRQAGVSTILDYLDPDSGQGISSSDVNHTVAGLILTGELPLPPLSVE